MKVYFVTMVIWAFLDPGESKMCHDHAGKEFIIIPFTISTVDEIFQIHVGANPAMTSSTSATITTPLLGTGSVYNINSAFSIPPSNRASINIQNFDAVPVNVITNTAIVISTDHDVIVSVSYGKTGSLGSLLVFPSETLGTEYVIVTYSPLPATTDKAILVIAAAYPDTTINLQPGSENVELTINGIYYSGTDTSTLNLAQYESIVITSSEDLTGIRVNATKPVAVYSGNLDLSIKDDGETDAALEQIPPVSELGQSFIVVNNPGVTRDFIKIVGTVDNTDIYVDSVNHKISLAGGFIIVELNPGFLAASSVIVTSSYPVLVALVSDKDVDVDNEVHDVTLTIVPPVNNYGNSFVIVTPTKTLPYEHYLVLISPQGHSDDLRLDGSSTSQSWTAVTDLTEGINHEFVSSMLISEGLHVLTSVNKTHEFGGYLYGTMDGQSYGTALATFSEYTWTVQDPCFISRFAKIVEDKLPFPAELSKQTTRTFFRCYQLCSISTTCGVVAVSRQSPTAIECRFYEFETKCGPFQDASGFKLYVRQT